MTKLALAVLFATATAVSAQDTYPLNKSVPVTGTILCREQADLENIVQALQHSLQAGQGMLVSYNRQRDDQDLPLCAGIDDNVKFVLGPVLNTFDSVNAVGGLVIPTTYIVPVLYRRISDSEMTTGFIILDKPTAEMANKPQGVSL